MGDFDFSMNYREKNTICRAKLGKNLVLIAVQLRPFSWPSFLGIFPLVNPSLGRFSRQGPRGWVFLFLLITEIQSTQSLVPVSRKCFCGAKCVDSFLAQVTSSKTFCSTGIFGQILSLNRPRYLWSCWEFVLRCPFSTAYSKSNA